MRIEYHTTPTCEKNHLNGSKLDWEWTTVTNHLSNTNNVNNASVAMDVIVAAPQLLGTLRSLAWQQAALRILGAWRLYILWCNRTVPPCSVGRRTGHAPGPAAADCRGALQTTDNADRRQHTKQCWPIMRASNKQLPLTAFTRLIRVQQKLHCGSSALR